MGGQGAKARSIAWCQDGTTPTLKSAPSGGNTVPDVVYPVNLMVATRGGGRDDMRTCFGIGAANDPQFTLSSAHEHAVCYAIDQQGGKTNAGYAEDVMMTIMSDSHGTPHGVCYAIEGNGARPSHQGGGHQRREDVHVEHD